MVDQGIAILITAVVAGSSIFVTGTFNRRLMRKQHTYRVLERMNPWKRFDKAVGRAAKLIAAGRIPNVDVASDEEECDNLDFILNHYEFISAAIICGDVDEALVRRVEDGRMRRTYLKFLPYVDQNRQSRNDIKMWESLEFLVHRWEVAKVDDAGNLIDWFRGKPSIGNFHNERDEVAKALHELAKKIK
jgi:hypothetical protein